MKTWILLPTTLLVPVLINACSGLSSYEYRMAHSEGARLFDQHCAVCHHYAEDLKEPTVFLERAIHEGGQNMPSFDDVMTAGEQHILAEYLANL
jgi:hypothetical protein